MNRLTASRRLIASVCGLLSTFGAAYASAEDVVIARSTGKPAAEVRRTGEILDYTGVELRLRTALGRDEVIPAGRIVEIQTQWIPAHEAARAAREAGKLSEAIAGYEQAKSEESRPWALRQVAAELAGTWLERGDVAKAGDEFLTIVAADPATPHLATIPLAWQAVALDAASEARAAQWLADESPDYARLLGASWLLGSSHQADVENALVKLVDDQDPNIAALARIQRWRTRLATASTGDLQTWSRELDALPPTLQAAGWYVLGDGFARAGEAQRAAIAYLKPPLVFREQRSLAAEGLLAAADQVEKLGQTEQAARLYRELVSDFGHLPAAEEARQRLAVLR
jgi:tetratricopeptide (TPR) repeat protein